MRDASVIGDEYDRRAYEVLLKQLAKSPSTYRRWGGRAGNAFGSAARKASRVVPHSVTDPAGRALRVAFMGLRKVTIDPAFRSIQVDRVLGDFNGSGHVVSTLDQIRKLPLQTIDLVTPGLGMRYALSAAAEGAMAGLAITGGELLGTVGSVASAGAAAAPGMGTVATAMAVDAAAVIAASARVVAHVGAYYGYDTRLPEEQVFALAVINWSSATTEGGKSAAFAQLSLITQKLVRGSTWAQLSEQALVRVVQRTYESLGMRLTKRKLGQAIPAIGVVVGAGLNAGILHEVAESAQMAYRLRHLEEKYGVTPSSEVPWAMGPADDVIDIDAIVQEAERDELGEPGKGA